MNKSDLIEEIAQRIDLTNAEAHRYVATLEEVIAETLNAWCELEVTTPTSRRTSAGGDRVDH